jgi:bifunctional non-homologous end joining protein LigD
VKRLAVQVEDHPLAYGKFEGVIPEKQYGAGQVYIWDEGTWSPEGSARQALKKGHLDFTLDGGRLRGKWVLLRTRGQSGSKAQWLLIKRTDQYAKNERAGTVAEVIGTGSKVPRSKVAGKVSRAKSKLGAVEFVPPQLASLVDSPPEGADWVHETKFDGYRTQALIEKGKVKLLTRTAQDWTSKYAPIATALEKMKIKDAILDGEIVALKENGQSDFQRLQNLMKAEEKNELRYYLFDCLRLNGEDLRGLSLVERKERLQKLLKLEKSPLIFYSEHFHQGAREFLKEACGRDLEGVISKKADRPYISGRGDSWVKSKCTSRQEFVIGGFTDGTGSRLGFGALLLGVFEEGQLRYVGRVGTGFDQQGLLEIRKKLSRLQVEESPFDLKSPKGKGLHWLKPKLVAEIEFSNWTQDGLLRVPVFRGLREDKPAAEIRREKPEKIFDVPEDSEMTKSKSKSKSKSKTKPISITHPDKILYPKEGITKLQVSQYYRVIAPWILPHLSNRPLSLLRCPEGVEEECFFQKHLSSGMPPGVDTVRLKERAGIHEYMTIDSEEGLVALVQMGAFELHAWNSRKENPEFPDQFVMDFDPDKGVSWKRVIEAAQQLKEILDQLSLQSFIKVTGGKGLHVHVPIEPIYSWEQIRGFTKTLAQEMVSRAPRDFTATMSKQARKGKIFIDYLRNSRGATAVVPYSLRAKPTSSVALPISWDELPKIKSSAFFTLEKTLDLLSERKVDPWAEFFEASRQKIRLLKAQSKRPRKSDFL